MTVNYGTPVYAPGITNYQVDDGESAYYTWSSSIFGSPTFPNPDSGTWRLTGGATDNLASEDNVFQVYSLIPRIGSQANIGQMFELDIDSRTGPATLTWKGKVSFLGLSGGWQYFNIWNETTHLWNLLFTLSPINTEHIVELTALQVANAMIGGKVYFACTFINYTVNQTSTLSTDYINLAMAFEIKYGTPTYGTPAY